MNHDKPGAADHSSVATSEIVFIKKKLDQVVPVVLPFIGFKQIIQIYLEEK